MKEKERQILFQMVIRSPGSDRETRYTILDEDPSFSSLTPEQRKKFIKIEQKKIMELISRSYLPHSLIK